MNIEWKDAGKAISVADMEGLLGSLLRSVFRDKRVVYLATIL